MKTAKCTLISITILSFLFWYVPICLSVPNEINFQGRLMDSDGFPVSDGNYYMMFLVYDSENSGSPLWGEYHNEINVSGGIYNVVLGTGITVDNSQAFDAALFSGEERWLEITVQSETLAPRQKISSVAYALQAQLADSVVDASITTAMLQDLAINQEKLADGAVTSAKIEDGTITNDDIADDLDADTVDGLEGASLEESDEIDTDITTHSNVASAHHSKTTNFTELLDSATDAQIPNDITIDQAANADTVDDKHASEFADVQHDHSSLNAADGYPLNAISVDNLGNVGIGVTDPELKLHVNGLAKFEAGGGSIAISTPGGYPGFITFAEDDSRSDIVFHPDNIVLSKSSNSQAPDLNTNGLVIHENGNVGIGTPGPEQKLHVSSNSNPRILVEATDTSNPELNLVSSGTDDWAIYKEGSSGNLKFFQSNDRVTIQEGTGNVGIGVTDPELKLHVNGLAKFEAGGGSIAVSTPGGYPGFITFGEDGSRSDMIFDDDFIFIGKSIDWRAPEISNGLMVHENGSVGIGTLTPGARLEVKGEVRTTSSTGASRLWGQGRPNVKRYGIHGVELGLCPNGLVTYGLSSIAVVWGNAAAACPAGTWVCTQSERGTNPCDTARPDSTTKDYISCDGTPGNSLADNHHGWLADVSPGGTDWTVRGYKTTESGYNYSSDTCRSYPVWCCSGDN